MVGPAVNEVAGIASMRRAVEADPDFLRIVAAIVEEHRRRFVLVGGFALRGVGKAQDLYSLDAEG